MLILNSAWPFAAVQDPGFTGCAPLATRSRISGLSVWWLRHTATQQRDATAGWGTRGISARATESKPTWFSGAPVRVSSTRTYSSRCSHSRRVVAEARRVGHRLPWQPEGKPFHPAGGTSRQGRVKRPENPSLHPPYRAEQRILDHRRTRLCPHFDPHKYSRPIGRALPRALSTILLDQANVHAEFIRITRPFPLLSPRGGAGLGRGLSKQDFTRTDSLASSCQTCLPLTTRDLSLLLHFFIFSRRAL